MWKKIKSRYFLVLTERRDSFAIQESADQVRLDLGGRGQTGEDQCFVPRDDGRQCIPRLSGRIYQTSQEREKEARQEGGQQESKAGENQKRCLCEWSLIS